MAGKLVDFMLTVAMDPAALAEYQRDPDRAVAAVGLSVTEQGILRSGNPGRIRDAVVRDMGERAADADSVVVITLTWVRSLELDQRIELGSRFNDVVNRMRRGER